MSVNRIIFAVIAVIIGVLFLTYNRLVQLRQARQNAFADIDVQLRQRYDLVPRLVETVKGYAAHEKGVMETVTAARAQVGSAQGDAGAARLQAESALGASIGRLLAVSENYPALKADASFQQLMGELTNLEDKIAAARRFFNNATSEYNSSVQMFPANIFAGMFGFRTEPFFEIAAADKDAVNQAPDVKF